MKLVMTLLVRDESDIVDAHLAYHLNAGVDFVVATDHRSQDGTGEILASYERLGMLHRIYEGGEFARQATWQTRMARLATVEHGADWVINSDADEFWWPRAPSLKDALGSVSGRYGVVRGLVRNFVPLRDDRGSFASRMTVRLSAPAPINDPATAFRPVAKAAHRGNPGVVVWKGSHQVFDVGSPELRAWYPLEVLHFPLRTREQSARKYRNTWTGWEENLRGDLARAREASVKGHPDVEWDRVALDDDVVHRGLAEGSLVSDTRLRDALEHLRKGGARAPVELANPSLAVAGRAELDAHVHEAAVFAEAELVRYQRWVDEITARVGRLEGPTREVDSR